MGKLAPAAGRGKADGGGTLEPQMNTALDPGPGRLLARIAPCSRVSGLSGWRWAVGPGLVGVGRATATPE